MNHIKKIIRDLVNKKLNDDDEYLHISFKCSERGSENILKFLKELETLGNIGSTREVKIEWDGDGNDKISDIKIGDYDISGLQGKIDERRKLPLPKPSIKNINTDISELPSDSVEQISDGFHTFEELYTYRMLYNAALFNEWSEQGKYDTHKSRKHSDGEPCFGGGWFIVVAELPTGQISNHYKDEYWELFDIEERELPAEYDGHTPLDVSDRLREFLI